MIKIKMIMQLKMNYKLIIKMSSKPNRLKKQIKTNNKYKMIIFNKLNKILKSIRIMIKDQMKKQTNKLSVLKIKLKILAVPIKISMKKRNKLIT